MSRFYIDSATAIRALKKMKSFHDDLNSLMNNHGIELTSNLGRRNILLSQAQEIYFAKELGATLDVTSSGKTGEPDIKIHCLGRELECKITSPSQTGSVSFQTDYDTLLRKKSVDYLYIVANAEFDKFAVFHYLDLNVGDFGGLSNGSRGKIQMAKYKTIDRLNCLVGNLKSINQENLEKLSLKLSNAKTVKQKNSIQKSIDYWNNVPTKFSVQLEKI
jgi:hypothetical protein